jgi:hypothetical protein
VLDTPERLKAGPDNRMTPVVIWSGEVPFLENKPVWLEDHHLSVLGKPFDLEEVYACLERAFDEHQTLRDKRSIASA